MPDISMTAIIHALEAIPPLLFYVLLFVGFTTEGTSFPFIHVPAAVMFLASAHLIAIGQVSLTTVVALSAAGGTLGAFITHLVGVRMALSGEGNPGEDPPPGLDGGGSRPRRSFLGVSPRQVERVWGWLERYGAFLAAAARWLGVFRPPILLGTGMARISPWKVVPALALGSLSYCLVYQLLALEVRAVSFNFLKSVEPEVILLAFIGLSLSWVLALFILRRAKS